MLGGLRQDLQLNDVFIFDTTRDTIKKVAEGGEIVSFASYNQSAFMIQPNKVVAFVKDRTGNGHFVSFEKGKSAIEVITTVKKE